MVNSGRHLALEAVRHLLTLDNVALTVTVGRDAALEQRVRALGNVEVFGWTKELPRLMAEAHFLVSKAGGATVQECLAAATPMLVSQIVPGQEEGNARLIAEAGAGALATDAEAIARAVRDAAAEGGARFEPMARRRALPWPSARRAGNRGVDSRRRAVGSARATLVASAWRKMDVAHGFRVHTHGCSSFQPAPVSEKPPSFTRS